MRPLRGAVPDERVGPVDDAGGRAPPVAPPSDLGPDEDKPDLSEDEALEKSKGLRKEPVSFLGPAPPREEDVVRALLFASKGF